MTKNKRLEYKIYQWEAFLTAYGLRKGEYYRLNDLQRKIVKNEYLYKDRNFFVKSWIEEMFKEIIKNMPDLESNPNIIKEINTF